MAATQVATVSGAAASIRLFDIAVNLTDCVFRGIDWKGKTIHDNDFPEVMRRAAEAGVDKILVSGTSFDVCKQAVELCKRYPVATPVSPALRCTIGIHPANCSEFDNPTTTGGGGPPATTSSPAEALLDALVTLANTNRDVVTAVGEMGLDYAELSMCPKDVQQKYFDLQIRLAEATRLPVFFHSRECGMDFVEAVRRHRGRFTNGVVHSFNGSLEELQALLALGLSIGLNGSAFRTIEQSSISAQVPLDRLMLETDAPWCDIRAAHFGSRFVTTKFPTKNKEKFVFGQCVQRRHEPCHMRQVLEACAGAYRMNPGALPPEGPVKEGWAPPAPTVDGSIAAVAAAAYANSTAMLWPDVRDEAKQGPPPAPTPASAADVGQP